MSSFIVSDQQQFTEKTDILTIFQAFCKDPVNWKIPGIELNPVLNELGQNQYHEEIFEYIQGIDEDQDGSLLFEEFLSVLEYTLDLVEEVHHLQSALGKLLDDSLTALENPFALPNGITDEDRISRFWKIRSNLCALIARLIKRVDVLNEPSEQRIVRSMIVLLCSFTLASSSLDEDPDANNGVAEVTEDSAVTMEESLLVLSSLIGKIQERIFDYCPDLIPLIITYIKKSNDYDGLFLGSSIAATGLIGDLSRALKHKFDIHSAPFLSTIIQVLQDSTVDQTLKPHLIFAIADIAIAIEGSFVQYWRPISQLLQGAGELELTEYETEDADIRYLNTLHEAILSAYTGIIQGLRVVNLQHELDDRLLTIQMFLLKVVNHQEKSADVLKNAILLLGDLGQAFGGKVRILLQQPLVDELLQEASQTDEEIIDPDTLDWVRSTIETVRREAVAENIDSMVLN